jgi:hypothetical protein
MLAVREKLVVILVMEFTQVIVLQLLMVVSALTAFVDATKILIVIPTKIFPFA